MHNPSFSPTAAGIDADFSIGTISTDMNSPHSNGFPSLTLVVLSEVVGGESKFVAQCVEYDICVQASSIKQLKERLQKTIQGHVAIAAAFGKRPFECIAAGKAEIASEYGATEKVTASDYELTLQIA